MAIGANLLSWVGRGATLRHRGATMLVLAVASILMLAGVGKSALHAFEEAAKAHLVESMALTLSGPPDRAMPATLLDVDDATRSAWGARGATPHGALAELIGLAASNRAAAILVDFDLTMEGAETPADPALLGVLGSYPADAPPLMLVRRIDFARAGDGAAAARSAVTPYDGAVKGKSNILWVSALNNPDPGGKVRSILLWQAICDGASGEILPAPALAFAALSREDGQGLRQLTDFLERRVAMECGNAPAAKEGWPELPEAAVMLPFAIGDAKELQALFRANLGGKETVVFRRISSGQLVGFTDGVAATLGDVDADPFQGRAVVIGASYTGSGDFHDTPLGRMPGSLVLANSLVQAHDIVNSKPVSPLLRNGIAVLLLLVFALAARKLVTVAALAVIFFISLVALFAFSRLLGYAAALDIAMVSLGGFAMFKFVDAVVQTAIRFPERGWKAVLKE